MELQYKCTDSISLTSRSYINCLKVWKNYIVTCCHKEKHIYLWDEKGGQTTLNTQKTVNSLLVVNDVLYSGGEDGIYCWKETNNHYSYEQIYQRNCMFLEFWGDDLAIISDQLTLLNGRTNRLTQGIVTATTVWGDILVIVQRKTNKYLLEFIEKDFKSSKVIEPETEKKIFAVTSLNNDYLAVTISKTTYCVDILAKMNFQIIRTVHIENSALSAIAKGSTFVVGGDRHITFFDKDYQVTQKVASKDTVLKLAWWGENLVVAFYNAMNSENSISIYKPDYISLIETLRFENSKQEQELKQLREMLAFKERELHNMQIVPSGNAEMWKQKSSENFDQKLWIELQNTKQQLEELKSHFMEISTPTTLSPNIARGRGQVIDETAVNILLEVDGLISFIGENLSTLELKWGVNYFDGIEKTGTPFQMGNKILLFLLKVNNQKTIGELLDVLRTVPLSRTFTDKIEALFKMT